MLFRSFPPASSRKDSAPCRPNGGLLLIFGLHRHFRGIRRAAASSPRTSASNQNSPLGQPRPTSFQDSKSTFAIAEATEGPCVRSRKDIQLQAGHAAGRLRFPCRTKVTATSLAGRRCPQHPLRARRAALHHPQLAPPRQPIATGNAAASIAILLGAWNRFNRYRG